VPQSRFVSAQRLKPLLIYCAVAFVVVLLLGGLAPAGRTRSLLVIGWLVLFPIGGWMVFRRG
jgi:hypothetical protein